MEGGREGVSRSILPRSQEACAWQTGSLCGHGSMGTTQLSPSCIITSWGEP